MKKIITGVLLAGLLIMPLTPAHAQFAIIKEIVKKVIRAMDLKIQRQQNKIIWLQNAQKVYENQMSKLKLKEISDWSEKQRKLYDDYFQELKKVKNLISTYRKVREIIARQITLFEEYKRAWHLLRANGNFSAQELDQMFRIYSGILDESLKNIDQLMLVTTSLSTQMSDGKRLELIDDASRNLDQNLLELRRFNNSNFRLSVARAQSRQDAELLKKIYGLSE